MAYFTDPYTGLQLYELSHEWGFGVPSYPGQDDVQMKRGVKHAQHGVLASRIKTSMHTGTHLNAPLNMVARGATLEQLPVDCFFGNGIVLDIPKGSYETIDVADLEPWGAAIQEGDVVVIDTGWHKKYSDSLEYYGECPGMTQAAAQWLVDKKVKLVAVDTQQIDHPMACSLGFNRNGPMMKRLPVEYAAATGKDGKVEHSVYYAAHKTLAAAGIPTVEQVGGDVDEIKGCRATFAALPWKIEHGEACQIRFVAMIDPNGTCRIDTGLETE